MDKVPITIVPATTTIAITGTVTTIIATTTMDIPHIHHGVEAVITIIATTTMDIPHTHHGVEAVITIDLPHTYHGIEADGVEITSFKVEWNGVVSRISSKVKKMTLRSQIGSVLNGVG